MDPMMAMMLAQGLQGFADNLGAARRGVAPPQQGGAQDMVPMMSMMQRNQLAQQQFAIKQQQAKEEAARNEAAARALNIDPAILALNPSEFGKNAAEASGVQVLSPGQRAMIGERVIANNPALLQAVTGGFANVQDGTFAGNKQMLAADLAKAATGATRISNPVTITQDTLSAKLTETPAEMFKKMAERADSAQSALDASRSIYELAKLNPKLIGPGMKFTAEGARMLEAARKAVAGGEASADQQQLLAVAQAMDIRQAKSAITTLRDFGGNDTEKELARSIKNTPGIETSLPAHELIYIQEKTAADYLNNMVGYVADYLDKAQRDGSIGIPTVEKAKREYMRQNPLGDQLSANLKAVMEANGMKPTGGAGAASKPDPAGIR